MPTTIPLQYITDATGKTVSVVVPIDVWREIESERETAYLLQSDVMKQRLLAAQARTEGVSLEAVRETLGI